MEAAQTAISAPAGDASNNDVEYQKALIAAREHIRRLQGKFHFAIPRRR